MKFRDNFAGGREERLRDGEAVVVGNNLPKYGRRYNLQNSTRLSRGAKWSLYSFDRRGSVKLDIKSNKVRVSILLVAYSR